MRAICPDLAGFAKWHCSACNKQKRFLIHIQCGGTPVNLCEQCLIDSQEAVRDLTEKVCRMEKIMDGVPLHNVVEFPKKEIEGVTHHPVTDQ